MSQCQQGNTCPQSNCACQPLSQPNTYGCCQQPAPEPQTMQIGERMKITWSNTTDGLNNLLAKLTTQVHAHRRNCRLCHRAQIKASAHSRTASAKRSVNPISTAVANNPPCSVICFFYCAYNTVWSALTCSCMPTDTAAASFVLSARKSMPAGKLPVPATVTTGHLWLLSNATTTAGTNAHYTYIAD